MAKLFATCALFALLALHTIPPAQAHKVIASAYAAGDSLEGEVGMSNGDMAADVLVEITDPTGRALGKVRTDAEGFFSFTPSEAVDHVFRADLGAGHVAQFTVPLADLPRALREAGSTADQPPTEANSVAVTAGMGGAPGDMAPGIMAPEALRTLVAEAVRDEVRPLRRELAAYKEKNNLQTILGGIGYIIGLAGLGFYLMARRRLKDAT